MNKNIAWLARRYARFAASGCCLCWSNCDHSSSERSFPDKDDKRAFMEVLKNPNYDTSFYERNLTRIPKSVREL